MKKFLIVACATALLMSSCATIFTGTRQYVTINTDVEGVKIYGENNCKLGETNNRIKVKRKLDGLTLILKHPDYKKIYVELDKNFNPVAILNLTSILGWGIDCITGSVVKYEKFYEIEMEKK